MKNPTHKFLIAFVLMFGLLACNKQDIPNTDTDTGSSYLPVFFESSDSDPDSDPDPESVLESLTLDEIKAKAQEYDAVYTLEDIRAVERSSYIPVGQYKAGRGEFKDIRFMWLKDFKNWNLEQLPPNYINGLMRLIYFYTHSSDSGRQLFRDGSRAVLIDDDGEISTITFEQFKKVLNKYPDPDRNISLYTNALCVQPDTSGNIFPVEYILQLTLEEMRDLRCLTGEQILALTDEQIMNLNQYVVYVTDPYIGGKYRRDAPDYVPFPPERLINFGTDIGCLTVYMNKEQVQALTPEQAAIINSYDNTPCLREEQIAWLKPSQFQNFEEIKFSRNLADSLSEEQLRAFTPEQVESIPLSWVRAFCPKGVQVFVENGTATDHMHQIVEYQDLGTDLFENLEYLTERNEMRTIVERADRDAYAHYGGGIGVDPLHERLSRVYERENYISCLLPEQFAVMPFDIAENLSFDVIFILTPSQIAQFPYFIDILNIPTRQYDRGRRLYGDTGDRIHVYEGALLRDYDFNLSHIHHLSTEHIRAVAPNQIQRLLEKVSLQEIYSKFRERETCSSQESDDIEKSEDELLPFAPEQYLAMTEEQFKDVIDYHYRYYYCDEDDNEWLYFFSELFKEGLNPQQQQEKRQLIDDSILLYLEYKLYQSSQENSE